MPEIKSYTKDQLFALYNDLGSVSRLAKYLKTDKETITKEMERLDLRYDLVPRKYKINHHFFNPQFINATQLYWAGFIASSGLVTRQCAGQAAYRIQMNVSIKDKAVLEKMVADLGSDVPVKDTIVKLNNQPYLHSRVVISSKYLIQDLEHFNITPGKKNMYMMPNWLLVHPLLSHFLRGWVDGKGGFYSIGKDHRGFKTRGSQLFLNQISIILKNKLNIKDMKLVNNPRGLGMLSVSVNEDVEKIAHYLYDDANEYVERKMNAALFEKYENEAGDLDE